MLGRSKQTPRVSTGLRVLQRVEQLAGGAALGLQRPQLLTQALELLAASRHRVRERFTLAATEFDPALVMLYVGPQGEQPLGPLAEHALAFGQLDVPFLDRQLALGEARLERRQLVAQGLEPLPGGLDLGEQIPAVVGRQRQIQHAHGLPQALVAGGLLRLPLDRADLASDLAEDVVHAQQVLLGGLDLGLGLAAARLVLADPRSLLDQDAGDRPAWPR